MKMKDIKLGDILVSEHGFSVVVVQAEAGHLVGKLICEPGHSCENINYSLNDGIGFSKNRPHFIRSTKR